MLKSLCFSSAFFPCLLREESVLQTPGQVLQKVQTVQHWSKFRLSSTGGVVINATLPRRHRLKAQLKPDHTKQYTTPPLLAGMDETELPSLKVVKLFWRSFRSGGSQSLHVRLPVAERPPRSPMISKPRAVGCAGPGHPGACSDFLCYIHPQAIGDKTPQNTFEVQETKLVDS